MEINGEEKYLVALDMALKTAKNIINTLNNECDNADFKRYLNTIQGIREEVQNKIIDLS